jgi:hypothetical protein
MHMDSHTNTNAIKEIWNARGTKTSSACQTHSLTHISLQAYTPHTNITIKEIWNALGPGRNRRGLCFGDSESGRDEAVVNDLRKLLGLVEMQSKLSIWNLCHVCVRMCVYVYAYAYVYVNVNVCGYIPLYTYP